MSNSLKHLAIIMDGNGRWAQKHNLPRIEGHKKGAKVAKEILSKVLELNIPYLTLFAFSSENWKRPQEEISELIYLIEYYLKLEFDNLIKNNIKLNIIGDLSKFPTSIRNEITRAQEKNVSNAKLHLQIALNYGSRQELIRAVKNIVNDRVDTEKIDESLVSSYLYTNGIPDPDLLIRTSGEQRLSNFLLWQSVYSELYFSKTFWPEFTNQELENIIEDFKSRSRRYGDI